MSNKSLATGVVIGVVITGVICYIIYLENEKKKLIEENDLLKQRKLQDPGNKIVSINSIPEPVRTNFKEIIEQHAPVVPIDQSYHESLKRIQYLKDTIENRDGYQFFYKSGKVWATEKHLHVLYDLSWYQTNCDVNKEVNNGRGAVDFKVSIGLDKTLVEFKMGSNSRLEKNLQKQTNIYQKSNHKARKIIVIFYTSEKQEARIKKILKRLRLLRSKSIILIDARNDNKPSASVA
ncbi:MAG: hypothetical protein JNK79_01115 [Chitinophagaceae bacterium]|nr:hypothetical protein [Chitinophagaceae bacterium]